MHTSSMILKEEMVNLCPQRPSSFHPIMISQIPGYRPLGGSSWRTDGKPAMKRTISVDSKVSAAKVG